MSSGPACAAAVATIAAIVASLAIGYRFPADVTLLANIGTTRYCLVEPASQLDDVVLGPRFRVEPKPNIEQPPAIRRCVRHLLLLGG